MIRFAACLLVAIYTLGFGQKAPIKYGEIPMEDMQMSVYAADSSAVAVVLADYGNAWVSISSVSAKLEFDRHIRIKILKKGGLGWADASIQLLDGGTSEETVSKLKATTYNLENGKIVETKMSKESVFRAKFNRNINLQKFTLPNVKEGSVIEYSYNVSSDFLYNFPNWKFQYDIPVRHSEYWAVIPDFFVMEKYMQGYVQPTVYEAKDKSQATYNEKAHHWVIKNVPAFKVEPYMTSEEDYMSKINFALAMITFPGQMPQEIMTSWQKLNNDLLEDEYFGKVINGSGYLKKVTEEVIAGETDEMKKVEKIYSYVRNNLAWDGHKDYLSLKPKEIFDKKKGTSGDINLTLASMLEKAGLTVEMVLLSTRDHGFIREQFPMAKQFNYVVCAVRINGKPIFLDATDKYLPVGVLPERCLNGQGLMISKNFHGWVPLESKIKERTVISADIVLNELSEFTGKVSISHDGYDGANVRKEYGLKGETEYVKNSIGNKTNWQVSKSSFENLEDNTKSVKETHELTITDHAVASGDIIYLNPFVMGQMEQNPFKLANRTYPVDYGSLKEKVYMARITLPEGFIVDELPQNKILALPAGAGKYMYSCTQVGNMINVTSNFQISRSIFVQDDYPNLREFYSQVVAKQAEQIVLKKK
jgi:hypothetical protein